MSFSTPSHWFHLLVALLVKKKVIYEKPVQLLGGRTSSQGLPLAAWRCLPWRHLLCSMGTEVSETHQEASAHGMACSRHRLWAPWQQSFPGGSAGPGVPPKGVGAEHPLNVCGQPHQKERDASLLTEAPTSSRVTFSSCVLPGERGVLTCFCRQVHCLL